MGVCRVVENDTLRLIEGTETVLSIQESLDGNVVSVKLEGKLRSDLVLDFQDEMCALATLGFDIVLDCANVQYLSATFQRSFIVIQQKLDAVGKGSMVLNRVPKEIYEEFEQSGMIDLLQINRR